MGYKELPDVKLFGKDDNLGLAHVQTRKIAFVLVSRISLQRFARSLSSREFNAFQGHISISGRGVTIGHRDGLSEAPAMRLYQVGCPDPDVGFYLGNRS